MKITLHFWGIDKPNGSFRHRVYIHEQGSPDSLAYFERALSTSPRKADNYYDRHRMAKGDMHRVESEQFTFSGPAELRKAILVATGIDAIVQEATASLAKAQTERNTFIMAFQQPEFRLFEEMAKRARNGYPNWYGNTPKKEVARLRKQRDNLVIDIDYRN